MAANKEVAAGGVVYRRADDRDDRLELLLIEDQYGHWTFPKGKREAGETPPETALREIQEETGVTGEIVQPLTIVRYAYDNPLCGTVDKEVHYYLVASKAGEIRPQLEEIKQVAWFSPAAARERQRQAGYGNNDAVLARALELLRQTE